jgi:hypothetical protein
LSQALRKLTERRRNIENIVERRDIISDYANYASRVYAPRARDGLCQHHADDTLQIADTGMLTFDGTEAYFIADFHLLSCYFSAETRSITDTNINILSMID